MPAYTVSNKEIIISPKNSFIKNSILPSVLVSLIGAGIVYLNTKVKIPPKGIAFDEAMSLTSKRTLEFGAQAFIDNTSISCSCQPWIWFLFGALVALMVVILANKLKGGQN